MLVQVTRALLLVVPSWAMSGCDSEAWFVPVHDTGIEFLNVSGREDQLPVLDQNGQGAAVIDADADGLLDLVFVNGATSESLEAETWPGHGLYRNLGSWQFEDATERSGLSQPQWGTGAAVGDVDGDGRDDLLITGWTLTEGPGGSVALYLNRGAGRFDEATEAWGLAAVSGYATGATLFDADGDGRADIFIGRYVDFTPDNFPSTEADGSPCLYRGVEAGCGPWTYTPSSPVFLVQRHGRFEDVSVISGVAAPEIGGCRGFQPVAADFDSDDDVDVYLGCDVGPNLLFENRSGGGEVRFAQRALEMGAAVNADGFQESGMGIAFLPPSGGGAPSLLVTNFSAEKNTLYENLGGHFEDSSRGSGLDGHRMEMGWGVVAEDFDGDGHLDVAIANGHIYPQVEILGDAADRLAQPLRLFRGQGGHRFEEVSPGGGLWAVPHQNRRALVVADLDADGRPDLVATTHRGTPELFRNVVRKTVRRKAARAANADAFRNQGYLSARDPRQFLAWAVPDKP